MGGLLLIRGSILAVPPVAALAVSGDLAEVGPLDERILVQAKSNLRVTLPDNNPFSIPVLRSAGGVCAAGAHVLIVSSTAKVTAYVTSADGAAQAIPVDGYLALISRTVPVTQLELSRVAGASTTCQVFLAEKVA